MRDVGDQRRARRRSNTLPVGLCGVLSSSSRVRGVTAARSSAASKVHAARYSPRGRSGHAAPGAARRRPSRCRRRSCRTSARTARPRRRARAARSARRRAPRSPRPSRAPRVPGRSSGRRSAAGARRSRRAAPGCPGPGGYWLWPVLIAAMAASSTSAGPGRSGKPWPRLIEPVATARALISAKIVVPKPCSRGGAGRGTGSRRSSCGARSSRRPGVRAG